MLKKKITKAEKVEKAKAFLRGLSTDHLTDRNQKRLSRLKCEVGKEFTPKHWGLLVRAILIERRVIKVNKKGIKRRKRRVKGKQATAQPVTSDNSTVVPMAGRTIDTGSAADGLIRMQRVLPGLIKLIQQTEETVAALTGEEQ